ncbi:MAG: L,D-transpeptidase [Actinomycetes bacterium]
MGTRSGDTRVRALATACAAVLALTLAGCEGGSGDTDGSADADGGPAARPVPPEVTITPVTGTSGVRPDEPVHVEVRGGRLTEVSVTGPRGRTVPGALGGQDTSWTSTGPLRFDAAYTVHARASTPEGGGRPVDRTVRFTTLDPRKVVDVSVAPIEGETVGVGMPIVVYFDEPVEEKAAVERRLDVQASTPVDGAWHWFSDTEVHFRPRQFWAAGTRVTLDVSLAGTRIAPGIWSDEDREVSFDVGASMVSVVDVDRHRMVVRRNGEVARRIPVSTGKAAFLTRGGTKVVLEKHRVKVMDASTIGIEQGSSEYYRLRVEYALRVTWSGEFVHSAPWSVGSQGSANVSHGCVGMSPAHAIWLFERSQRGDVVKVVGSPRRLEEGNGFTDWNLSWPEWVSGSALS